MEKKYRIRYMPAAQKDLLDIFEYISTKLASPQAALGLLSRLDEAVQPLAQFPYLHEKVKDPTLQKKGYRVIPVDKYLVFYVVTEDVVKIRRVLYNKRLYSLILF